MIDETNCNLSDWIDESSREASRRMARAIEEWLGLLKGDGLLPSPLTHQIAHWPEEWADEGIVFRLALIPDDAESADWGAIDNRLKLTVVMPIKGHATINRHPWP